MKEYRKVVQFYYKNNLYNMYLDNNNKYYFLKNSDMDLSYIRFDEFIDLILLLNEFPLVMRAERNDKNNKIKILPKVLIGGVAVTLTLSTMSLGLSMYHSQERIKNFEKNYASSNQQSFENYVSYDDDNQSEELIVDTYLESDWLNYLYIYDMDYLNKVFDYDNVTTVQVKELINSNDNIPEKYKELLYDYCDALDKKYHDIELRVLYENLKTLEVIECSKEELIKASLSVDSYGCYIRNENKIYVLDGYEYEYGTWAYQVIFHEFSHCLRTGSWNIDDKKVKVQVEGQNFNNTITAEALNSLFTVSLFDYDEKDIAYQLQSNYHSIMIECMDNYSLNDYIEHSLSYYANKLDEFNKDNNYATVILELISMQYKDYHNNSIAIDPSAYYPIYDYISNMYYKKYINSNMTYFEATEVSNQLIDRIMFDVPENYNIDTNHFKDYLTDYCNSLGIDTKVKSR